MIPAIVEHAEELKRFCVLYHVQRLDLFGSAVSGRLLTDHSDLDFLVEFKPAADQAFADSYFGLLEALHRLFGRPVDLIVDSAIKNPYFLQAVKDTRVRVYES